MDSVGCPKCGALSGVVVGLTGQPLSCANCAEILKSTSVAQKQAARKEDLEQLNVQTSKRQAMKDAVDIGTKLGGLAVAVVAAAVAVSKSTTERKNKAELSDLSSSISGGLSRLETSILMALWEQHQKAPDLSLTVHELALKLSSQRLSVTAIERALAQIEDRGNLVIVGHDAFRGASGKNYRLDSETMITRPISAVIPLAAWISPSHTMPEGQYYPYVCLMRFSDGRRQVKPEQVGKEIEFCKKNNYVGVVHPNAYYISELRTLERTIIEMTYLEALTSEYMKSYVGS